jgi:outer membrane protein W
MVKRMVAVAALALALAAQSSVASGNDLSEKGVPTSPLFIYTGGIGVGAIKSMSDELKADQSMFMKLSFMNSFYFRDNMALFFDADWFIPGDNFGADFGFDFIPFSGDFRPFIGAGVGAHYFDKSAKFGDNFGPSGTVHLGFIIDVTDQVQLKVSVPMYIVGNTANDLGAGVNIGMMFGSRFRTVKKLDYNRM